MPSLTVPTQFGPLTLWEDDGAIVRVDWEGAGLDQTPLLRASCVLMMQAGWRFLIFHCVSVDRIFSARCAARCPRSLLVRPSPMAILPKR